MSIRTHEITAGGQHEGTPEYLDALERVHGTFGDDFGFLDNYVSHPNDYDHRGVELAIHTPLERDGASEDITTLHPLGLGNVARGHQILYGQLLSETLGQKVVTISAPSPQHNYDLSPRDRWRVARGNATPYVDHIIDTVLQYVEPGRVAITTSTQPGSAIAPRLASRLQERTNGEMKIEAIEVADPATVMSRRTTEVLKALTETPHSEYAVPLNSTVLAGLYRQALNSTTVPQLRKSSEPGQLLEQSFNRNVGKSPLHPGLLLSNAALAAFMGHQTFFNDLEEVLYYDEDTRAVVASTNSPVAPEEKVRASVEQLSKQERPIAAQLSFVAVKGVTRGWWDNPGNLARLRSFRQD
jgi:hypothetical protein